MPIYEYECEECGRRTEALQRVDEDPLSECPHCAGPLRKLISAPAFQFKGSGWYVTDYAGKGGGKGDDKGGETGSEKGGDASGGGAESKDAGPSGSGKSAQASTKTAD